jgi:tetratricopeptide (TPR) repeat protein
MEFMMLTRSLSTKTTLVVMSLCTVCALMVGGCESTQSNHEQWKKQADNRWHRMRSSLLLDMANQQFESGDLERAKRSVQEGLSIDRDNSDLLLLGGRIALERGQLERGLRLFEKAIENGEDNPRPYYYKGVVLQRWQQFQRAHDHYKRAYEMKPDEVAYLIAQSEMLVQLGQQQQAIKLLEGKQTYFDQNSTLRTALGHLYNMQQRYDKAAVMFKEASLLNPDNARLKQELALAQLASGQAEASIQTFETLFARAAKTPRADLRRALASAYVQTGRSKKARQTYLELVRSEEGKVNDWIRLAELAWQAGDAGGTLDAAHRAMSEAPNNPRGYMLAGMVFNRRGKLDEALQMFDRAAKVAPDDAKPLILRGLSLQRAGRGSAAVHAYEKALQRQPDHDRAKRLLQAVKRTLS